MAWWDYLRKLYDISGVGPFLQEVSGLWEQPVSINPDTTESREWQAILTENRNPFWAYRYAASDAWERAGGWKFSPYIEAKAAALADIDPDVLYGLYHQYLPEVPQQGDWLSRYTRALMDTSLGRPAGVPIADTPREAAALMAASLAPEGSTYVSELLREAVRNDDYFAQYQILRDSVAAALMGVHGSDMRSIILRRLDVLYYDYRKARDSGAIPPGTSFIEYVSIHAADQLSRFFPGLRWDQVDDLWLSWRLSQVSGEEASGLEEIPPVEEAQVQAPAQASAPPPAQDTTVYTSPSPTTTAVVPSQADQRPRRWGSSSTSHLRFN